MTRRIVALFAILLCLCGLATAGVNSEACQQLQNGMFTFHVPPVQEIADCAGVQLSEADIDHIRKATVEIRVAGHAVGSSGSFISDDGIVATNAHLTGGCAAVHTKGEFSPARDGFFAESPNDELKCTGLSIYVLEFFENKTDEVKSAIEGLSTDKAEERQKALFNELTARCKEESGLDCQVRIFDYGSEYWVYGHRAYPDVRLRRHMPSGLFFCDTHNFEFVRIDDGIKRAAPDYAELRVWQDGKPAVTPVHFEVSDWTPVEDTLVISAGVPGTTSRGYTADSLRFELELRQPLTVDLFCGLTDVLRQYAALGEEQAGQVADLILGASNTCKVARGNIRELARIVPLRQEEERSFRQTVSRSEHQDLNRGYYLIDRANAIRDATYSHSVFMESGHIAAGQLYSFGMKLVRLPIEDAKPDSDRLKEYSEGGRDRLLAGLLNPEPIFLDLEERRWELGLGLLAQHLPGSVTDSVLMGKDPATRAHEIITGTRIHEVEFRRSLVEGGATAIDQSDDPVLQVLRLIEPTARVYSSRARQATVLRERGQAQVNELRAVFRGDSPPDANNTLRLTAGFVAGYEDGGQLLQPVISVGAIDAHLKSHKATGAERLLLPEKPLPAFGDSSTPLHTALTLDMVGGQSGSPVLVLEDGRIKFRGVFFDGNADQISSAFSRGDIKRTRSIIVNWAGAMEVYCKLGLCSQQERAKFLH